jgi:hypothetical protein
MVIQALSLWPLGASLQISQAKALARFRRIFPTIALLALSFVLVLEKLSNPIQSWITRRSRVHIFGNER